MIRFIFHFRYANGVSVEEGEKWYLGKHLQDVKKVPGVRGYLSWRGVEPPEKLKKGVPQWTDWTEWPVRRSDLYFDDYKDWEASRHLWVAAKQGEPGFGQMECLFAPVEEEFDLLRDCPPLHIKYITMPMLWRGPGGLPPGIDEDEEWFAYSYLVTRIPGVSDAEADEWYMGHHTREGKQCPGMRWYKTWKSIRVPEQPGFPLLQPNRWRRLTELGIGFNNHYTTMLDREVGIQFTPNPRPPQPPVQVLRGIYIKLERPDELIKLT